MQIDELYKLFLQYSSIKTDTRKIQPNDLFFALKGPSFNGNHFAKNALQMGAAYAIVDEFIDHPQPDKLIQVTDVLTTLQQLAKYHREQFSPDFPVLAITGSNGKTTTKELIHQVLSSTYITYTTVGNLNNHIGIPLTILSIKKDAQIAVIEMGANHQKEIESYCAYAKPTLGLITNCGKAHLEGFGGEKGIRKGKGELFDYLRANNGTVFIMQDYDYLKEMSKGIPVVFTYGTKNSGITGEVAGDHSFLVVNITHGSTIKNIHTQLIGEYNLPNVLAAVCVGKYFKVDDEKIKEAIENYIPTNSRSQLVKKGTNSYILDAYNANPTSMKAAIEHFGAMRGNNKVLLLGSMMELGNESITEHKAIVDLIAKYSWHKVVLVGGDFAKLVHPYLFFKDADEAGKWLMEQSFTYTQFLIKGSRSMQMEKVLA